MAGCVANTTSKGVFAPGTRSLNQNPCTQFEEGSTIFLPEPTGPYEETSAFDRNGSQEHYVTREIKLRRLRGTQLPATSYRDHYPPKSNPLDDLHPPEFDAGTQPFTSTTEYDNEFTKKAGEPFQPKVDGAEEGPLLDNLPTIQNLTTNQRFYKPFTIQPKPGPPPKERQPWDIDMGSFLDDTFSTTYRQEFVEKEPGERPPLQQVEPRPHGPMLNASTTYTSEYVPKQLALVDTAQPDTDPGVAPFDADTTYGREFVPKEPHTNLPHLTGVKSGDGIQLPLPRRSLGVQYVVPGKSSDLFFVLIPRHLDAPCTARQIFTTVNDNQEQACILVLYGDDSVASNNMLLGQFDLVNIPPAPKDVPRIEVTFHLDKRMNLTVEARDLDTLRHKMWLQRGEVIVRRA